MSKRIDRVVKAMALSVDNVRDYKGATWRPMIEVSVYNGEITYDLNYRQNEFCWISVASYNATTRELSLYNVEGNRYDPQALPNAVRATVQALLAMSVMIDPDRYEIK